MKKVIKKLLAFIKAHILFCIYWQNLRYINADLESTLMQQEKSVLKYRKGIIILHISKLIKPKKWTKSFFGSNHEGLNLFDGLGWIDRYLKDICKEIPFEIYFKLKFENDMLHTWNTIVDMSRFEQFYDFFETQYVAEENIFLEVFISLVLSGVDPSKSKVIIMVDGDDRRKIPGLNDNFGRYTYRVFLGKLNA